MSDTKLVKHRDSQAMPSLFPWMSRQWFDDVFHDGFWRPMIAVEEYRDGDTMVVRAELPGVDPDRDVELEVIDDTLVISAEKSEASEHEGEEFHRSEFRYGSLTRSVPIPRGVKESDIVATYKDGVLEVRMPLPASTSKGSHKVAIARG